MKLSKTLLVFSCLLLLTTQTLAQEIEAKIANENNCIRHFLLYFLGAYFSPCTLSF